MSLPSLSSPIVSTLRARRSGLAAALWLTLALLLAGLWLGAEHRHVPGAGFDGDCATCLLSSATTGAAVALGWPGPLPALTAVFQSPYRCFARTAVVRFCDSRAPPTL